MYYQKGCPCSKQYRVAPTSAYIRILHASPNALGIDVYVNNMLIVRNLTYKGFTQYVPLAGGLYNIKAYRTGTNINPLIDKNINIPPNTIFTIAAVGMLADIDLELVQEPPIRRLPNETFIRFAHLSPDTFHLDVALLNGTKLFSDVEYKEITDYIPIRPGTYEIQLKQAGTNNIVLRVPNTNLRTGHIYTVYAVGLSKGSPPLQVLIPLDGNTYLNV